MTGPVDYELASQGVPPPPVPKPRAAELRVGMRRVIRVAPYESAEIDLTMVAEPDPGFTAGANYDRMFALVRSKIDAYAAQIPTAGPALYEGQ